MTDITELAQSLENAASKALIEEGLTWFCEEQLSHEDGIALHKADAEFIALANPTNILALVEALEKAQAQSSKWLEAYHKAVSIGARYEERIAELESRSVKLPKAMSIEGGAYCSAHAHYDSDGDYYDRTDVEEMLSAAGIKVEAE
ncbi:TPA: hypothetical protein ACUJAK_002639 [Klebsiella pneumoniae]